MKAKKIICIFLLAALLINSLTTTAYFGGKIFAESEIKTFSDVGENYSWAKDEIEFLAGKGIINGTENNKFEPGRNITRAEFITLLVKALDLKAEVDGNFKDVSENAYYYEPVGIAKKLGITTGIGNDLFNPNAEITRQDMMVICVNALKISKNYEPRGTDSDLDNFIDRDQISSYAVEPVASLVKEGIISGYGNAVNPKGNATRAETAVIMYKIYMFEEYEEITVYLVGDSTVCNYDEDQAPREGWGQELANFFTGNVKIDNRAASGRSSKSFIEEGKFSPVKELMKKGDYLFIQFGHNDEKDDSRHTDPYTTFKETLTEYINAARSKGAQPVLITPVARRKFDKNGQIVDTHGSYPAAMIELAKEEDVPYIDLCSKSMALFNKLGPEGTLNIFLHLDAGVSPNYPDGVSDDTHFQKNGAIEIAKLVIEGIKGNNLPLARYIKGM